MGGAVQEPTVTSFRGTYSNWSRGSSGGGGSTTQDDTSNRFDVLENISNDSRRGGIFKGQNAPRLAPGGTGMNRSGYGSRSMPPPTAPSEKDSAISAVKKFIPTQSKLITQ